MPREPWPQQLAPVRDDMIAVARGLVGGVSVIAVLIAINRGLPMLSAWLLS